MTNILESFTETEFPTRARTKGNKFSDKYLPLIDALKETPGKGRSITMPYTTDDDKAAVRAIVQHVRAAAKERGVTALKDVSEPVESVTVTKDESGKDVESKSYTVVVTFAVTAKVTKTAKDKTETDAAAPDTAPEAPAEDAAPEAPVEAEVAPEAKPAPAPAKPRNRR